jgi:uncharacterized protein
MAVMIWLGIYPLITAVIMLLFPFMNEQHWPIPLRTLVITLMVVPLMTFVVLPFLQTVLRKWLQA